MGCAPADPETTALVGSHRRDSSKAKKIGKIKTGILRKLSIGFDRLSLSISLSIKKERDRERKRDFLYRQTFPIDRESLAFSLFLSRSLSFSIDRESLSNPIDSFLRIPVFILPVFFAFDRKENENETKMTTKRKRGPAEMILEFASRYACLGDLDKWAASRLQVACK